MHTAEGALKLLGSCAEVPVKSMMALRAARSMRDRDPDHRAVVHLIAEIARLRARRSRGAPLPRHCPAHGAYRRRTTSRPKCRDHAAQLLHAFLVGRDLRAAGRRDSAPRLRAGYWPEPSSATVSASRKRPASTSRKLSISTPSSSTHRAVGRHRARRDAADIGVMAARADVEQDVSASSPSSSAKTGVITVMSGRCVPPL